MSNDLNPELIEQLYGQVSDDPFLTLFTFSHPAFTSDITLVNNSSDVVSRGTTFTAFPVKVTLPNDDNETVREVNITLSNVGLDFINEFRSVTTQIECKLEMVLFSDPDVVQYILEDLKLTGIQYNAQYIQAKLIMDDFLSVGLTSERYTPDSYPGLF